MSLRLSALAAALAGASARNNLARTPPMGWMSWEIFRCNLNTPTDNCTDPTTTMCISEALYKGQADAMAAGGFAAAGYSSIHMDDCWPQMNPPRDPVTKQMRGDPVRFPSGMAALGDYIHSKGLGFALYTAESTETCAGYPASKGYETLDADTFASWGVDYLKVDGCGDNAYYPTGYNAMGAALEASGRGIVYSCSWPAYIGSNETEKPFNTFIMDGCNLWRNWDDIQCDWGSLGSIIDHWGDWGSVLAPFAGPGHWHDPDMLLIGNGCITEDEERTQMAIWSIVAAPLIMGNDMRNVSDASKAILFNADAIAVDQDPLGQMGLRLDNSSSAPQQRWWRTLANGDVAVGLYNKGGAPQPPIPGPPCTTWNHTFGGYFEACGGGAGNVGQFSGLTRAQAQDACCSNSACAGFSYEPDANNVTGSGYYKGNAMCGFTQCSSCEGFDKPGQVPSPTGGAADITINFADVNLYGSVSVYDIWAQQTVGTFTTSYTAKAVPFHGTAFLRLSATS